MTWRRWIAAVLIGVSAIGVAACSGDQDPDEVEEQIRDEMIDDS